jgi:predicted AlkP superfamily phosphohydrolase/phosphomutase
LLPFFAAMIAERPLVKLSALSRVLQGSIWPSILTGLSPGHHGLYCFSQLALGTYSLDGQVAANVTGERFYTRLGAHGVRCAVVDVPTDLLDPDFPGLQVVDWGAEFQYSTFGTHPPELKAEIEARFGEHLLTDYGKTKDSVDDHRKLRDDLEGAVSVKSAFARQLLERDGLDLIMVVYGEPHKGGHFFWKYLDSEHPDHVPGVPDMHAALRALYQQIDRELAALVEALRREDNLIVFADHGMQANYRGDHFIEAILERLGLCEPGRGRLGSGIAHPTPVGAAWQRLRPLLHRITRRVGPAGLTGTLRRRFGEAAQLNWSRTQAFALPTDRSSYIRINVRGREPQGCVEPGADYDALLDTIEREFRALVNGETGEPAVEEVFRVQTLYPGPRAAELPDLAILWSSASPINVIESPAIGRLQMRISERRPGNHRAEGFLFAQGPAFRPVRGEFRGDILQIAPTLLALHGVPRSNLFEMGPLTELFSESMEPSRAIGSR